MKVEGFDRLDRSDRVDQDKSNRSSQDRSQRSSQERSEPIIQVRSERLSQERLERVKPDRTNPNRSERVGLEKDTRKGQNDSLLFGHEQSDRDQRNLSSDRNIVNLSDQTRREISHDVKLNQTGRSNNHEVHDRPHRDQNPDQDRRSQEKTDRLNNVQSEGSSRDKSDGTRDCLDPRRDISEGSEGKENLAPPTLRPNSKFKPRKETNEKFLDMEPLPEPPPTPPRHKDTVSARVKDGPDPGVPSSPINIPDNPSQPLVISTLPMSMSSSSVINKSEEKSNCSSSFDSLGRIHEY